MADKFDEMQEIQVKQSVDLARNNALMAQLVHTLQLTIDKTGSDMDVSFISEQQRVDVSQSIAKTGSENEKLEQEIHEAQLKVQNLQSKYLADTGKFYEHSIPNQLEQSMNDSRQSITLDKNPTKVSFRRSPFEQKKMIKAGYRHKDFSPSTDQMSPKGILKQQKSFNSTQKNEIEVDIDDRQRSQSYH